jgi:hypothetical protein
VSLNSNSIRHEIDVLAREQQLPILLITFAFWMVCGVEWIQRLAGQTPDPRFWTFLSLLVTLYSGFQVFRLRSKLPRSVRANSGGREVAGILQSIRSKGFVAFHDLPGADRKIDHVVVGPSGIYAIETKARSGSGLIDYRSDDELVFAGRIRDGGPLRHARGSATSVQSRLNAQSSPDCYTVKPLLVFLGNWEIQDGKGNFDVDVTTAHGLVEYFDKQKPELSTEEISEISSYLQAAAAA